MEINFENVDSNKNGLFMSRFLGFPAGSSDAAINPYHTIPQNNKGQNDPFMSDSQENHKFHANFGDLTISQFPVIQANNKMPNDPFMRESIKSSIGFDDTVFTPQFEDLSVTHHTVQQINLGDSSTLSSHGGITFTYPLSGQNDAPFINGYPQILFGTNHVGSSSQVSLNIPGNTKNGTKIRAMSANRVNKSPSATQSKKRIRFRFSRWTYEETKVMDRELKKYTSLTVLKISRKIAALLPKKSMRDVAMRIKWLIKHRKLDNIWFWNEPSPGGDLCDFSFYMPDNPNDPDLLAIKERFGAGTIKHGRG